MLLSDLIPASIQHQWEGTLPPIPLSVSPWLPFPWPLQISSWGLIYGNPSESIPEIEWVRSLLQLQLSHPPIPLARPKPDSSPSPLTLSFCWGLNRIVQGPQLDQALQERNFDPQLSQTFILEQIRTHHPQIPPVIQVLLCLELLYRQISPSQQSQLKDSCGEDVMKAAYQLNMMAIDPDNADRTLLQLHRIGLKLCQDAADQVEVEMHLHLSDGRQL